MPILGLTWNQNERIQVEQNVLCVNTDSVSVQMSDNDS